MVTVTPSARSRTYLMCPPEHYVVEYAINPWMDTSAPIDTELAVKQWVGLRETLAGLGHTVHVLDPVPGLPDMVFTANGAFSVDGVVYGARFRYAQRMSEAAAHRAWYEARPDTWRFVAPRETNEGEGDFAFVPGAYGGLVLAGYGFRTEAAAHSEAQEVLGHPVVSLRLVDPRFYHLDVALAVLDDENVVYLPGGVLGVIARDPGTTLPQRGDRRRGGCARVRSEPGQRRAKRGPELRGDGARGEAGRGRLRAGSGRAWRAQEGRR